MLYRPRMSPTYARRLAASALVLAATTACGPKAPPVPSGHAVAIAATDYALALAFDDDALSDRVSDPELRAVRVADFEHLIQSRLAPLAPVTEANARATFGTLAALRREAARGPATPIGSADPTRSIALRVSDDDARRFWAERQQDLAAVDARVLAPRFDEVAAVLWRAVDAHVARGELSAAIVLGATIVAELPKGTPYGARLDAIGKQSADLHLGIAQATPPERYGARLLHARLAAQLGTDAAELGAIPAELTQQTALSWTISSDGPCGDSPIAGANSDVVPLTTTLPREGFAAGPGQPMRLSVTFDRCPVTPRAWETTEETEPYLKTVTEERLVVKTGWDCVSGNPSTEKEQHFHSDGWYEHTVTTTTSSCAPYEYTDGETEEVTYQEERVTNYGVSHVTHHIAASGTIRIAFDGGVREAPFALEAISDEDVRYNSTRGDIRTFHGFSEPQARERLHTKLVAAIHAVRRQVLDARAATFVADAQQRAAAGDGSGAEHAFFLASQIAGRTSPEFTRFMDTRYHVTPDVLAAAVFAQPVPRLDLASDYAVELPVIPLNQRAAFLRQHAKRSTVERRRSLLITGTVGLGHTSHAPGALWGGRASVAVMSMIPVKAPLGIGTGLRWNDGGDLGGARLIDIDTVLGGGLLVGGLAVAPLVGFGGDFTPGAADARDGAFVVPGGAYAEYGARISYAFKFPVTVDAVYTKAFRAPDALPRETRLDVRLLVDKVALTARYTEYGAVPEAYAVFGADGLVARTWWLMGGVGF